MFDGPRYHPLIICDTEGKEAAPMFFTNKESGVVGTDSYREESIPGYYHLKYGSGKSAVSKQHIHSLSQMRKGYETDYRKPGRTQRHRALHLCGMQMNRRRVRICLEFMI